MHLALSNHLHMLSIDQSINPLYLNSFFTEMINAAIAQGAVIPGSIFQSWTRLLGRVCMASAHDCTTSSKSDEPGSRRAGCPTPPGLPFHVWRAQPWLAAFPPWRPVSTGDTAWSQNQEKRWSADHFRFASEQQAERSIYTPERAHTHSLLCLPCWCNVSESRRSGEAGAEQRASGLVLGPGPKHCLIECRGGQDRTMRPLLQRLRLPST